MKAKTANSNGSKGDGRDNSTLAHTKRAHTEASKLIADCRKKDEAMMESMRSARKK